MMGDDGDEKEGKGKGGGFRGMTLLALLSFPTRTEEAGRQVMGQTRGGRVWGLFQHPLFFSPAPQSFSDVTYMRGRYIAFIAGRQTQTYATHPISRGQLVMMAVASLVSCGQLWVRRIKTHPGNVRAEFGTASLWSSFAQKGVWKVRKREVGRGSHTRSSQ